MTDVADKSASDRSRPSRYVQYRKWDGSAHWRHDMILLGSDEHGTWLGAPAGSVVRKGPEPPTTLPWAYVQLIRADDAWTAVFNRGSEKYEVYVDMTTPAVWVDDQTVEMIDMDLDVVRRIDGTIDLLDEDEFAEHQVRFEYPDVAIEQTEASAQAVLTALEAGVEPFASRYRYWLDQL